MSKPPRTALGTEETSVKMESHSRPVPEDSSLTPWTPYDVPVLARFLCVGIQC